MDIVLKTEKSKINSSLPARYALICFASFEKRSTSVPLSLDSKAIYKAFVLRNRAFNSDKENGENVNIICDHIPNHVLKEVDLGNPIVVADTMTDIVKELISNCYKTAIVDISTFTHEALLVLLRLFYENRQKFDEIYCLYNGATEYSGGVSSDKIWLSKGCRDVRNVIGYPGLLKPSAKNHLILLTGYEYERATRLIEILEPDLLSLGDGNEPTDSNHEKDMKYFKEKFYKWKNSFQGVTSDSFDFSCRDVKKTIEALNQIIDKAPEENHIIVPLNTKLSTVACAMVALHNPKIQVCYAVPEMYNVEQYSTPSDNITIINLYKIEEFT